MTQQILRLPAVRASVGVSRSTHYAQVAAGLFTRPVKLGPRCVGWPRREVDAILDARIAGKSDAEIRQLVIRLEAERKVSP